MKVTEKDVVYVAGLAHLELTAGEQQRMVRDLNSILDYVDRLNELDTKDVPPMAQVRSREVVDASREDEVEGLRPSLPHQAALANAPETDGAFFMVPKVIEK
jgi:aspartyl-tRNA(Asn)/glutamyl-tRNA(Gln) amidotransferase subunit C